MRVVERLTCPFCRSRLNPGAVACHGCGAVRGGRPVSYVLILLVFPIVAAIVTVAMSGVLGPDRMGGGGILLVFFGSWIGFAMLHGAMRSRIHWTLPSVGAVHREGEPEIHRDLADDRRCPACAEMVKSAALKCRFCGFDFAAPRTIGGEAARSDAGPIVDVPSTVAARGNRVVIWPERAAPSGLALPPPPPRRSLVPYLLAVAAVLGIANWHFAPDRDTASAASSSTARPTPPEIPGARLMAKPERERIAEVQRLLSLLGYDVGSPDGVAGAKTRAAIARFRAAKRMPPGDIDRDLAAMLEAAAADKWVADTLGPKPKR